MGDFVQISAGRDEAWVGVFEVASKSIAVVSHCILRAESRQPSRFCAKC